jgi:presenilin-like A22 family membrane protease
MLSSEMPRDIENRIRIGLVSLMLGGMLGFCEFALLVTPLPKFQWLFGMILAVTHEFLIASTIFFSLLLVWAIATPPWVERLFVHARKHFYISVAVACIPLGILMVLALFGIKLGKGLEP